MQGKRRHRTRQLATFAPTVIATALLSACGGSSAGSSPRTASASSGTAGTAASARFAALRKCLKAEGITLPQRVPGEPGAPPTGGAVPFGALAGARPPHGVSRARFQAALQKCGVSRSSGRRRAVARRRGPAFTKALARFTTCMRRSGVNVPEPDTSGHGPIFNSKGLDTRSATFRAAERSCSALLSVATPGARGQPAGAPREHPPRSASGG